MAQPSIKLPGGNTPQWWQDAAPEQKEAWRRMDTALAAELGLERPYAHGPHLGTCPGAGSYGHGLTMRTTHGGTCCERWDTARKAAIASGLAVPTDADRAEVARQDAQWEQHYGAHRAGREAV